MTHLTVGQGGYSEQAHKGTAPPESRLQAVYRVAGSVHRHRRRSKSTRIECL